MPDATGAHAYVAGDEMVSRVKQGKHSGKVFGLSSVDLFDERSAPFQTEQVAPARFSILLGFPIENF